MSKLNIHQDLAFDWIGFIIGSTRDEIIEKFSTLPDNVEFDYDSGYNSAEGISYHFREETEEEYQGRVAQELEDRQEALKKAEKKRKDDQKNIDDTVANLKKQIEQLEKARPK